jgi:hypothetical protein
MTDFLRLHKIAHLIEDAAGIVDEYLINECIKHVREKGYLTYEQIKSLEVPKKTERKGKMTKEFLLGILASAKEVSEMDEEEGHYMADEALLEYIDDKEIKEAFEAIRKWYA